MISTLCSFDAEKKQAHYIRYRYGAPISRRRIYIFMVREDIMNDEAKGLSLDDFMKKTLRKMHVWPKTAWTHSCKKRFQQYLSWF